jgi:ATP-dependent exoDNAse (exonuclease V) beta subunit
VFAFDEVPGAERAQEREERLRLYYVAMTRAIDRLVVSGAVDLDRSADRETPIGWVLDRLGAAGTVREAGEEPVEIQRDEARFVLRVDRFAARAPEPSAVQLDELPEVGQLALFGELPLGSGPVGITLSSLAELAAPPVHDVRRLSYSALALFERCSYRYFAERVAGLRPVRDRAFDDAVHGESPGEGAGLPALAGNEIGDAVHRLLELVPLDAPAPPARADLDEAVRSWYPAVTEVELDRVAALVDAYCDSELAQRLARLPGARSERPFAFEHDGVLFHGRLDVLWRSGGSALVVDYKSNALAGSEPAEIVDAEYELQRSVYALACLRGGAEEAEIVYQFLERPGDLVGATFTTGDVPALEAELSRAIARIRGGDFRPTPSEFACAGCPALDVVCAGPRLLVHG